MKNKFYVTPVVEYLDMENEGILCGSLDTDFDPYTEVDLLTVEF